MARLLRFLMLAACVAAGCTMTPTTPEAHSDPALAALATEFWEWTLREHPTSATQLGDHRHDDRLPDDSAAGRARQEAALRGFLERCRALDPARLAEADRVTQDVLRAELELALEAFAHRAWEWDVDQMFGPQLWFQNLLNYHPLTTARDGANLAARFEAYGPYMDAQIADLRAGLASGRTPFRGAVERVMAQCAAAMAAGVDGSPLAKALTAEAADDALRARLRAGLAGVVLPAIGRYGEFLAAEVLPKSRGPEAPGVASLPGGAALYAFRIRYHTGTTRTADQLHATGLTEVARIRAAMDAIARARGFDGLGALKAALAQDPGNFYASREAIVAHAQALLDEATSRLPDLFGRLPRTPCEVTPIEAHRERDAVAAFYNGPPADGSRPGRYYVNTHAPETRPRYNMPALTIHEAVPGHHLQIALAVENTALPEFRRHGHFTAYVEGWALYSERLGEEIGLYDTDLERLGMYTYEAWRACRLVVDTGLHHLGWSRQRALDYMKANLPLSEPEIVNEVDRYIIWPGQALAYKVGQLEILALRDRAREALGARFSLKDFHDVVLGEGAVPLSVLGGIVDRWIARVKTRG